MQEKGAALDQEKMALKNPYSSTEEKEVFLLHLRKIDDPEQKLREALSLMREALATDGSPRLKEFWALRAFCLPLFQHPFPSYLRASLWQQYIDLATEAKKLRLLLNEHSTFAYEQIDLAICVLEKNIQQKEQEEIKERAKLSFKDVFLDTHRSGRYQVMQQEIAFLHSMGLQVQSLHKEILQIDMRVRNKRRLLNRLSRCGDSIFPRKKELIQEISQMLVCDIHSFAGSVRQNQEIDWMRAGALRMQIKGWQSLSKSLTIHTQAFMETRDHLSACWDFLREQELAWKNRQTERAVLSKKALKELDPELQMFITWCQDGKDIEQMEKRYRDFMEMARQKNLARPEWEEVRQAASRAKECVEDRLCKEQVERRELDQLREEQRAYKAQQLQRDLVACMDQMEILSWEELEEQYKRIANDYKELNCNKSEKLAIELLFRKFKDVMLEKRKDSLLCHSVHEREQYDALKTLLVQEQGRWMEVKAQMEVYRKLLGGSSLDFGSALEYQNLLCEEKEHLRKIEDAIEEIRGKMQEIGL